MRWHFHQPPSSFGHSQFTYRGPARHVGLHKMQEALGSTSNRKGHTMADLGEPRWAFWQTQVWLRREEEAREAEDTDVAPELRFPRRPPQAHWEPQAVIRDHSLQDFGEGQKYSEGKKVATLLHKLGDELTCFANVSEDNKLHPRALYVLANEQTLRGEWTRATLNISGERAMRVHDDGWWLYVPSRGTREYLGTLDRHSLIPEKGPSWRNLFEYDEVLPLHLMRTVAHLKTVDRLNDALDRGWYLLAIEFEGQTNDRDELVHRETRYVVGHIEEHAR